MAPPWRTVLLVSIWVLAISGILYTRYKSILPRIFQHRGVYTGLFLLMGWTSLIRIGEIFENLTPVRFALLLAGGVTYSVGAIIYATKQQRLFVNVFGFHELWHIMVMLGFAFHYAMILSFYLP